MNSITRNNVKITIGTSELYGEISKHLAPVIVNQILMKKKLSGPIAKVQDIFVYSPLGIIAGLQKPKTDFKTLVHMMVDSDIELIGKMKEFNKL